MEVVGEVNDLTEILLMTRQKLVFSVGASRFNVVSQADGDESHEESSLKM